ncbi:hypothetical protein C8035_v004793 [Colletotrichum spinosum]|uniref:Uncharacterized protein n=1 Tax=Colletotrichum spinosum TaxID=1347390 RepID=A0A4R8QPP0_9PEZI|nr:hypothetical protein C8035_v004793 [Colletotrichum spinosum]
MPFLSFLARVTSLLAVLWLATLCAARIDEPYFDVGPGPYREIRKEVEGIHRRNLEERAANKGKQGNLGNSTILEKFRINPETGEKQKCGGVYLCDQERFRGNCYWGCYPEFEQIYPHGWWVVRIVSFGPDPGVKGYLSGGECTIVGPYDKIGYPGKTLDPALRERIGCFYVAYHSI